MLRPDLSYVNPDVRAYVDYLESEVERLRGRVVKRVEAVAEEDAPTGPMADATEAPTTAQIIMVTQKGLVKRTARHLYERQHRAGMGAYDIDLGVDDSPALMCHADESEMLIAITSKSRAFRVRADELPVTPVRGTGQPLRNWIPLQEDERLAALVPAARGVNLAVLSQSGFVRTLPAHVVGQAMTPGVFLYRYVDFGTVAAACWTPGQGELFIATRNGLAIRFAEKALAVQGGPGIRLEAGDVAVAVEAVRPPEGENIFLLGADGKGTIRQMAGFAANKAPGGGGKIALKTDKLVSAIAVNPGEDIFIAAQQGKVIRFKASEVPPKEGVVQGVHCMSFRADACVAAVTTR